MLVLYFNLNIFKSKSVGGESEIQRENFKSKNYWQLSNMNGVRLKYLAM